MAERALVALGSNIDPARSLARAVRALPAVGSIVAVSRVYQSAPVGATGQADYLNAAVALETALAPAEIRRRLRAIEAELGRVRTADKFAPRTIDLDLALYGGLVIDGPELVIPPPELVDWAHVIVPLADAAPDFPHPETGATLDALAAPHRAAGTLVPRDDVVLAIPA